MKGFKAVKLITSFSSRWVGKVVAKWASKLDAFIIDNIGVTIYGYNLSIKVFLQVGGWVGGRLPGINATSQVG